MHLSESVMQNLLTNKTASLTELRNPKKVIKQARGKPIAILNRDHLEGYFVPASAVDVLSFEATGQGEAVSQFKNRKKQLSTTLKYLKDK
jgi:hypothetical protein